MMSSSRDLSSPLLPRAPPVVNSPTTKDDGSNTAVTDESGRWYAPSDHEEDNAPPDIKAERLRSLRLFRKYTIAYCE